jgi:uncharacterized protein (DUF1800 family)
LSTVGVLVLYSGGIGAQMSKSAIPASPDVVTVAHVLNRLAFGPRPGDVDRVRAQGLAAYIEAQLHPERIDNAAMETRLADFPTLTMSQRDLADKYFIPAEEVQRRQRALQGAPGRPAAPPDMAGGAMTGAPVPPTTASAGSMGTTMQPEAQPARPLLLPEERLVQQAAQNATQELLLAKMLRASLSERQLEEVLTDFWFNHFNVFLRKGQVRQYLTTYEQQAIRPHVFGSFREMLGAVAHHPAMLFYLDNFQSASPTPAQPALTPEQLRRLNDPRLPPEQRQQMRQRLQRLQTDMQQRRPTRGLNENYGRELLELHTLGVDAGYTQKDVTEAARVLTGWTIDQPQRGGAYLFRARDHDTGEKIVLGERFPAGRGEDEGERLLDILAKHPATARHISFKLAQRFVSDEPPAALVERAAKVFIGTRGDLREVTRAIVTSPEFFAADAYRAKVKTPLEFVVSSVRATGAEIVNAQPLVAAMRNLGMPLYEAQPPTGYSMTADAWVNTGALLNRMNFAVQLVDGGRIVPMTGRNGESLDADMQQRPGAPGQPGAARGGIAGPAGARGQGPGGQPGQPARGQGRGGRPGQGRGPVQVDVASLAPDTTEASRDALVAALLAGQASAGTRATLARAGNVPQLVALTLGSPEFQRR